MSGVPLLPLPRILRNPRLPCNLHKNAVMCEEITGVEWGFGWDNNGRVWVRKDHKHVVTGAKEASIARMPFKIYNVMSNMAPRKGHYFSVVNVKGDDWYLVGRAIDKRGRWHRDPLTMTGWSAGAFKGQFKGPQEIHSATLMDGIFDIRSCYRPGRIGAVLLVNDDLGRVLKVINRT